MKLRNKKTREIIDADFNATISGRTNIIIIQNGPEQLEYNSLAELNEEWEDYEELKEYYYLNEYLELDHEMWTGTEFDNKLKAIGNYFETEDEAEKAVRKLKAWKRLKDKGIEFTNWEFISVLDGKLVIEAKLNFDNTVSVQRDLEICFGGEE